MAAAGPWPVSSGLAAVRRHRAGDRRAAGRDDRGRVDGTALRGGRSAEGRAGRHSGGARRPDDAEGAIARQGYDPGHVLAEIGATNAELDALGVVLDTDPRKATKTGAAKAATGDEQA